MNVDDGNTLATPPVVREEPAREEGLLLPGTIVRRISPARSAAVAARVGIVLGAAIAVCFVTGLLSHWIQHPPDWFRWPANPPWLYRVTQGAHVISGVMAIPLLIVKLWSVFPRLFARPLIGNPLRLLERGSIAVLVGSTIFQLATGLFNIAQFYPWRFFFTSTHYAMAYVALGALAVHLAVKLPVIRTALSRPPADRRDATNDSRVSRRGVLGAALAAAGVAGIAVAGQSVPWLRWVSVLAPRTGEGPQGLPVNRTATEAGVDGRVRGDAYRLTVSVGTTERGFSRAELERLPQTSAVLPLACVEGWSASAHWSGVRLRDLLAAAGGYPGGDVAFHSLEQGGLYSHTLLPTTHVVDDRTLVALRLNGEELSLDHGYPCRLIAPNRPGVLQTKWLSRIEVRA
ncbi:DMSO/TMAO reductase YedYZ molybdopterin-dependent catalytic subunit [Nocardia transvalensis]|uniref:DMSO/TMAO reductase YedYZ molybdopterin-dependent catalytic subunit n=1 Tax=Nocardia transvalensis TaxID=37333 RepID=A0A7W9UM47_9NOCA|nr:DMSO/TMAO reductase YedYZ molybdopterin-dependent catalytic subunit [Nocardia transvalensis]